MEGLLRKDRNWPKHLPEVRNSSGTHFRVKKLPGAPCQKTKGPKTNEPITFARLLKGAITEEAAQNLETASVSTVTSISDIRAANSGILSEAYLRMRDG